MALSHYRELRQGQGTRPESRMLAPEGQLGTWRTLRWARLISALLCLAFGMLVAWPAESQGKYPERSIRLVVPFAPGGSNDLIARLWVEKMKVLLGPVFIENQGGGGGLVGGAAVARANPDGYTILLGSAGSQVVIPAATNQLPYDPAKDLVPITILTVVALSVVVHPSLPVSNLTELADYGKANPGKLSYGSAGAGTLAHLTGELFKSLAETPDIVHVPYKGNSQSISDLMSGNIPIVILSVNGHLLELHRSGRVRMLAITTPARIGASPNIPTAVESGWPGVIAQNFYGLFAPVGTPKAIIEQISQATQIAMADNEFRQRYIA